MKDRLLLLVGAIVLGVAATIGVVAVSRGGTTRSVVTPSTPPTVKAAVISRLRTEDLHYRWVACVTTRRTFQGVRVVRCNVDFGEPHIVAYCAIIRGGRLVTNHETPGFACPADLRGWKTTIVTG